MHYAALAVFVVASCAAPRDGSTTPRTESAGALLVEYIAHACFRIESSTGASVVIDPYASRTWLGYEFPAGQDADAFLITHPHYDHDAGQRAGQRFPWGERALQIASPGVFDVGPMRLTGIAGRHAREYGQEFGHANTIFVIAVDGLRVVHWGDNELPVPEKLAELGEIDVLMLPIDDAQHLLSHVDVDRIREALDPKVLIPMHYRHAELEPRPDSPPDLGGIDRWAERQTAVRRIGQSRTTISPATLPAFSEIWIFDPHPDIPRVSR
jgi:L-ascorbate metabolism protein UlaG (beta-lactamase superfamily)